MKCLVAYISLPATVDHHIVTATQMFSWASEHIDGARFLFVSADDVADNSVQFDLPSHLAGATTFTGICFHHYFLPVSEVEMKMKRISADSDFTMVTLVIRSHNQYHCHITMISCSLDTNVKGWFVGCIVERSNEESDVLINFMKGFSIGLSLAPTLRNDQSINDVQDHTNFLTRILSIFNKSYQRFCD